MSKNLSSASLDFSGDAAVEQAIAVLQRFSDDNQFDEVHIELSSSWDYTPQGTRQAKLRPDENGEEDKHAEDGEDGEEGEGRKQPISADTSHHKVLTAIAGLGTQDQIPVTKVIENIDLPDGTVYAAMSTLYERRLVTREKGPQGNYLYTITEFGERELERLGRANI